ncbi:MAG: glycoside hydrolase [Synergistaceae bacterium]|jgi:spore germination protein YaaH|nr:glycoside hydrolase [Synergistaceae bacterium]
MTISDRSISVKDKKQEKQAKKVFIVLAVFASLLICILGAVASFAQDTAAEDPFSRFVRIERRISLDATNVTPHFAIVREHADASIPPDVWVPGELLSQMNVPVRLDASKDFYAVRVEKPSATLEIPALAEMSPNALDLRFRAKSDDGKLYFNLTGMEKVTGLTYAFAPNDTLTVGTLPLMSAYAGPIIKKTAPPRPEGRFNLVWDHVTGDNADLSAEEILPTISVISPTWFVLLDETGRVGSRGGVSYVESAHASGCQVWGLVSNGFNKARTTKFLADTNAQDLFIANMLAHAEIYGLDGINIDFESVDNKDASKLTAFVKHFTETGKTLGLLFSIDVTVPSKWSSCYERRNLSDIVDYIALMAYDEHWRSSPRAGSTASLPWVRAGLEKTLADVPPGKLLLGAPFYTREWQETKGKNGKVSLKSRALSMASVDSVIAENGVSKQWLEAIGQNYVEYSEGGTRFRIWVEDESSVALRLDLVKKHALAGAAFWRKGFETPNIWKTIEDAAK